MKGKRRSRRERVAKGNRRINDRSQIGLQGEAWVMESVTHCDAVVAQIRAFEQIQPPGYKSPGIFSNTLKEGIRYLILLLTHGGINSFVFQHHDTMIRHAGGIRCADETITQELLQGAWKEYRI